MMLPLSGRTVLVTRPAQQAAALAQLIREAGGEPYAFPALEVAAVDADQLTASLAHLAEADIVIFISPNAATFGMAAIRAGGNLPASAQVFAVGPGTARALQAQDVGQVATPLGQDSEALLALPQLQDVSGKRVVIVRGVGGRALLADTLTERGAEVGFLECYRRLRPDADATPLLARWQAGEIDAVTVTSAETLDNLAAMLGEAGAPLLAATPLFAPHEKIADAARRFGIEHVIATPSGDAGLIEGLVNWFRTHTMNDKTEDPSTQAPVPASVSEPVATPSAKAVPATESAAGAPAPAPVSTPVTPTTVIAPPAPSQALPLIVLLIAIGALAAAGWSWFDSRENLRDLRVELSQKLSESGKGVNEVQTQTNTFDVEMQQVNEKIAQIEAQRVTAEQQRQAVEALYKEMAQGRDQWELAEIEPALIAAAQQVQLEGNVKAAIIMLENADANLQRLDKPQFTALRRAIATDLTTLRSVPAVDVVGASARIEALLAHMGSWPLASAQGSEAAPTPRTQGVENLGHELWAELKNLVQIRRVDQNEAVLLPPNQAYFLRENLRLRLLLARLALLAPDQAAYQADLRAASAMLTRYFNTRDAGVVSAIKEIDRLATLKITVELPNIDASLTALKAFKGNP
ncbi:MAG: fused uroporphyrinogen-III synthase HemD/membrane protein HemX [Thiobacillus sp.]